MKNLQLPEQWQQYLIHADVTYAHEITQKLHPLVNSPLGGRNAGSEAEHKAAAMLFQEMRMIGLQQVTKDPFPVVKWQFNGASLECMNESGAVIRSICPYAYPSGKTPGEGLGGEVVFAGRGTRRELDALDVKGKIVLIDIDMRTDWWITYPAMEAAYRGAAALISSCSGGFSMGHAEALNCQDFVGPVTIPCVSISRLDADWIKEQLQKRRLEARLCVDNEVDPLGTSYNLTGTIPGKNSEEQILIGDHYDCHFWGFQDNNAAVGLTLAIAKGILDAGITPQRNLVFILHGAEESGALDTKYDWSVGAWNQINRVRPEWSGCTLAYLNFELPAYDFGNTHYTAAAPELFALLESFRKRLPEELTSFRGDPYQTGYSQFSWSDDWSYTAAGVPGMVNGFLLNKAGEVNEFFIDTYHSQYDHPDTYDEEMLAHHLKLYGLLTLHLDEMPLLLLDFSAQAERLTKSLSSWTRQMFPEEAAIFQQTAEEFEKKGKKLTRALEAINGRWLENQEQSHGGLHQSINAHILGLFRRCQDLFLRLNWEDVPIVGHEHFQANAAALERAIACLQKEAVQEALEALMTIEDEGICSHFSREVADHFTRQVMGADRKENLYWGSGRIMGSVDLYEIIQSLQEKSELHQGSVESEVRVLSKILDDQRQRLKHCLREEIHSMVEVQSQLDHRLFTRQLERLMENKS